MSDKEYKGRFDFDPTDIFETNSEDISSRRSADEARVNDKSKFVVHIDEESADSFEYDFEAFSSASEREAEKKRKEAMNRKFDELERELGLSSSSATSKKQPAEKKATETRKPNTAKQQKPAESKDNKYATVSRSGSVKKPAQAPAPKAGVTQQQQTEKKKVRMRTTSAKSRFATFALFLAVVAVFTATFTVMAMSAIGDILAIDRTEESVRVEVPADPDMNDVIDVLHDAGLIKQKLLCTLFAKYRHYDGYSDSEGNYHEVTYLAGIYDLEPKQGLEGMLNAVKESKGGAETVNVTFPEGWTITQIFERLEKKGVCTKSKLYANLESVAKQYDFYYDIQKNEARYLGVEGYLFPDTYEFYKNENAVSVLKKLFDNSEKKWKKSFDSKAKELGYTRDEILIIASMIQKEAANQSQMADVSAVIHNRLKSSTYPNLQCDSTSDYVTNHVKSQVDSSHAQIYADSYNTYKIEGLPPGPICNPGLDAIEAALNPSDTNYYFFCHNNQGKIYLSSTYDQFQKDALQVINDNSSN